ncbi:MAG: ABC transporter permease [Coriobacteriales bacterium]|nr:ABC transporter permease [Coriobacteriales bacterium]
MFIMQQLVTKDFKLKYRRSVLGILWSVLNPLLMMCVLTLVFSNMFRFPIENYPVYLILGMTLFTLMSDATNGAMHSMLDSAALIKKVRIEKAVFPIEKVLFSLVNYAFSMIAVICVMIFFKIQPSPSIFGAILVIIYVLIFSAGLGLLLSALTVFFRDVMHLWSVIIMAWNYLTPIFWPQEGLASLDSGLSNMLMTCEQWNPMYHYVAYIRDCMMYQTMPGLTENLICIGFAVVTFSLGIVVFRKTQHKFILYI